MFDRIIYWRAISVIMFQTAFFTIRGKYLYCNVVLILLALVKEVL